MYNIGIDKRSERSSFVKIFYFGNKGFSVPNRK